LERYLLRLGLPSGLARRNGDGRGTYEIGCRNRDGDRIEIVSPHEVRRRECYEAFGR